MKVFRSLVGVVGLVAGASLVVPAPLGAQTVTGTIDGRVVDESRAAVPGASVIARNVDTGLTRSGTVSTAGTYRIGSLPAGRYDVSVELTGFATQVQKNVEVLVGSETTVDFTMKVAPQAETITVTSEVPLIQSTTSDVGQVITNKMLENIPLNGRKFQDLSLLVPGTRPSNYYDPTKTEVGGISYGGATGRNVIISVDGADDNDGVVRGLLQQFSNEAIQEYKVTTQRYDAEFGRSTGGIVNVVTKSGTNDFHGSAFVFGRNESLNSKTFFQDKLSLDKPPFKQWQYGGTLGGPIEKDKAHFFLSYERNQRDDYATVSTNGALPAQEGNFPQPYRNNFVLAKVDIQLDDKNTLVARYGLEDNSRTHDFIGGNTLASAGAFNTNKIHSGVLKNTTIFGNNKLNEVVLTYQHFENNITAEDNSKPGIVTPDFIFGANQNTPQQTIQQRWQLRDDFSFRKENWGGDHAFKVGAELMRSHFGGFFVPTLYGLFTFGHSLGTDLNTYLNSVADTFSGSAGNNNFDDNWTYVSGYVQDDWKPTRRLTLNLGVRYEIQYGPYGNQFDTLPIRALKAAGYPSQRSQDYGDVAPRLGFAYDVNGNGRTVVRGGYGRYYDEIFQNITLYEYWSQVNSPTNFLSFSPAPFTPNYYAGHRDAIRQSFIDPSFAGQLLRLTAPDLKQPRSDQFNIGFSSQPARNVGFDVDYVHVTGNDEIARWRINTPQNVNTRISPAGVFAPALGPINVEGNRAHSKFDGVYFTGKVRATRAQLITTYTWSKAYSLANDFSSVPGDITNGNWELDWGPAQNDIRQRATAAGILDLGAGFQFSTGLQANTGKPINAFAGLAGLRLNVRAIDPSTGQMFSRNSFRAGPEFICPSGKATCQQGGDGGLAFLSWDARLSRFFKLGSKDQGVELLFEVFNITNHANFQTTSLPTQPGSYIVKYPSASFGAATAIIPNSQREAEFGARFRF